MAHRGVPALVILAVASLVVGLVVGANVETRSEKTGRRFAAAWARGDYPAMYDLLTPAAKKRVSSAAFTRAYRDAAATATERSLVVGRVHRHSGGARVDMTVYTRVFGRIG